MKRRDFMGFIWGALVYPATTRAQQSDRIRRIGVLANAEAQDPEWQRQIAAFLDVMKKLGWEDGRNFILDYRFAAGEEGRISAAAKELVALKPDVILARSTPVVKALKPETQTIPIVFVSVSDPVGDNFVATMARPGGNITGFTNVEASLGGKWVELLKEVAPDLRRAKIIFNPNVASGGGSFYLRTIEEAAALKSIVIDTVHVFTVAELETALAALTQEPGNGVIVMPDPFIVPNRGLIREAVARHRLPAVYGFPYMALEGGLLAYGVDNVDLYRRSAEYVDRVLKGAQPRDLPIQAPVRFNLVVNLKTAKALGMNVSPTLLARADEVIE